MSAIRVYGPDGRPTWRTIDDGVPEVGYHRSTIGGSLVVSAPSAPRDKERENAQRRAKRAREGDYTSRVVDPCGKTIRSGVCGRAKGHNSDHRSTMAMQNHTLKRRAA